jgi:hypothetical protein
VTDTPTGDEVEALINDLRDRLDGKNGALDSLRQYCDGLIKREQAALERIRELELTISGKTFFDPNEELKAHIRELEQERDAGYEKALEEDAVFGTDDGRRRRVRELLSLLAELPPGEVNREAESIIGDAPSKNIELQRRVWKLEAERNEMLRIFETRTQQSVDTPVEAMLAMRDAYDMLMRNRPSD